MSAYELGYFVDPDEAERTLREILRELDVLDRVLADDRGTETAPLSEAGQEGHQTVADLRGKIASIQQNSADGVRETAEKMLLAIRRYRANQAAGIERFRGVIR